MRHDLDALEDMGIEDCEYSDLDPGYCLKHGCYEGDEMP